MPFREAEAFAKVPPRDGMYGCLKGRQFIEESCRSPVTLKPGGGPGEHLLRLRTVLVYGVALLSG